MRITNQMMVGNFKRNIERNSSKMDFLHKQLATGKSIFAPSDDPVGTLRSMQLNTLLNETDQYIRNVDQANTWLDITELSLGKATDVLQRARELAVKGANGSMEVNQYQAIAEEVRQLKGHLKQIANASLGGRYVFGGQITLQPPYNDADPLDNSFYGDNGELKVEVSKGVKMTYNVSGDKVFTQALQTLEDLENRLESGTPTDIDDVSSISIVDIDNAIHNNLEFRAEVGAKMNRLEMAKDRYEMTNIKYQESLSKIEDVDMAKTIMDLKIEENVYRAALASGARIIQPSLVDFIK